jgi:hypothetical protein
MDPFELHFFVPNRSSLLLYGTTMRATPPENIEA